MAFEPYMAAYSDGIRPRRGLECVSLDVQRVVSARRASVRPMFDLAALLTLRKSRASRYARRAHQRAMANWQLKRTDEALADLDRALELSPENKGFLVNRGMARSAAGNSSGATDDLLKAIRLDGSLINARCELAAVYSVMGRHDTAIEQMNQAIQIAPRNATAYKLRGVFHHRLGDNESALRDCNETLRLGRSPAIGLVERAHCLYELGKPTLAMRDLTQALGLTPTVDAYLVRESLFVSLGQTANAAADARRGLKLLSGTTEKFRDRGLLYLWSGDLENALADFERMIDREPKDGVHYNNRGYARHQRGDFGRAIADYETAIRLSPEHPQAYKNLANLRANCADRNFRDGPKAVEAARRALELRRWNQRDWLDEDSWLGHSGFLLGPCNGVFLMLLLFPVARAFWRACRRSRPGRRAFVLGAASAGAVGFGHGLIWIIRLFAAAPEVWSLMPAIMVLWFVAEGCFKALFLAGVYAAAGGLAARALDAALNWFGRLCAAKP